MNNKDIDQTVWMCRMRWQVCAYVAYANPEDRFSHDEAHTIRRHHEMTQIVQEPLLWIKYFCIYIYIYIYVRPLKIEQ